MPIHHSESLLNHLVQLAVFPELLLLALLAIQVCLCDYAMPLTSARKTGIGEVFFTRLVGRQNH